jgi:two-component system sensor histidine kinase KdpD
MAAARARGRLRIYFGAAPGVGKTRAMLEDARKQVANGVDVVVGLVDTHDFGDLNSMRAGLESLAAPQAMRGKLAPVQALDLDAALARKPQLILVDDLARRNPEGSRHFQRWQDVDELLDHDIDVYATLNVLNIESLKEVVQELTKIPFRETVPDSFFERAEQVTLVDASPEDLVERLESGSVHLPQAQRMRRDLFRAETLASLRDLALRQATEHLEAQRAARRRSGSSSGGWPASKKVLVCIDHTAVAEKLVRAGKRLAGFLHADWVVAYCETSRGTRLNLDERERVQTCLRLADELGAEVITLAGYAMDRRIVELARQKNVGRVVVERPAGALLQRWRQRSILRTLERRAPEVDVFQVSGEYSTFGAEYAMVPSAVPPATRTRERGLGAAMPYVWSVAVTVAAMIISTSVFRDASPANHLIIYLLGVLFIASRLGFWPSAVAATLSVLASDYFLFPPYFSFEVARPQDVITLGVFLLAALIASRLTDDLRFQSEGARMREQRVRFLYEFTRALASVQTTEEVAAVAAQQISRELPWQGRLLLIDAGGRVAVAGTAGASPAVGPEPDFDIATAQWAFDNRKPAGWGTDTAADVRDLYLPVSGPENRFGVLALHPTVTSLVLLPEQRRILDTVVAQISQTLERIRLASEAHHATARVETETLRNSLLSAIAHDLRTPLASIVAASSTLLQGRERLSREQERDLTETILEEGQRMTKLANNTLEIARLEAGAVRLQREWYPLDEIVGTVLSRMEDRLAAHRIETQLPAGVPMAQVDLVTIAQVIENLVENAVKYTPPGTRIEIGARDETTQVVFWVADRGPGIAAGQARRIFEKFYRGPGKETQSGVGLGLTICRIIVEAHGGTIAALNRDGGGAEFRFTVPATEAPPRLEPEA